MRSVRSSYLHWIRGAYLITTVDKDSGVVSMNLGPEDFNVFCRMRGEIKAEGRTYVLELPEGLKELKEEVRLSD